MSHDMTTGAQVINDAPNEDDNEMVELLDGSGGPQYETVDEKVNRVLRRRRLSRYALIPTGRSYVPPVIAEDLLGIGDVSVGVERAKRWFERMSESQDQESGSPD